MLWSSILGPCIKRQGLARNCAVHSHVPFPGPSITDSNSTICFPAWWKGNVFLVHCCLLSACSEAGGAPPVSLKGVCTACGCAKHLDDAWTFIKATSFIRGCLREFWVCRPVSAVTDVAFLYLWACCSSCHLLPSCGKEIKFLSCSGYRHTDVFSYLVGLVHVFSLAEKGRVFVYVAGMGSNDCEL